MSQELDEKANEHTPQYFHHHACSNLFGCGDEKGIGILREDIKERAFNNRASDRLLDNCQFVLDGHNRQCVGRTLIHLRVSALSHPPTTRRQGNKMA